jgi:hypothetical protein
MQPSHSGLAPLAHRERSHVCRVGTGNSIPHVTAGEYVGRGLSASRDERHFDANMHFVDGMQCICSAACVGDGPRSALSSHPQRFAACPFPFFFGCLPLIARMPFTSAGSFVHRLCGRRRSSSDLYYTWQTGDSKLLFHAKAVEEVTGHCAYASYLPFLILTSALCVGSRH